MTTQAEELFIKSGAVMHGHFLLTSGQHSEVYWEKFKVLQHPQYTEQLCKMIADHFRPMNIQLVVGPTTGGVMLAYEVGKQLGTRGIFAETEGDKRVFRRGFVINPGERILIVDDVLTTGKSVNDMIEAVNGTGGQLVGIGVLVDRTADDIQWQYPFFSCLRTKAVSYTPDKCPLCAKGVPLVKPGSSKAK